MWTDVVAWFQTPAGLRVLDSAILPFVAIVLAGVLAALIGRSAVRGLLRRSEQDSAAAAVAAVLEAARRAATWPTLQPAEQHATDQMASEADLRLRLLPLAEAVLAADWASLRIEHLKRQAANFSRAPGPELDEVRDSLAAWLKKPRRAKRLFAAAVADGRAARAAEADLPDSPASPSIRSADALVADQSTPESRADVVAAHRHVAPVTPETPPVEPPQAVPVADLPTGTPQATPERPVPAPRPSYSSPDPEDDVDIDPEDRAPMPPPVSAISVRDRIRIEEPPRS